ncbi:DUF7113 family protein [Natronolimnobius baerhuensis]|uniref:Uncharacterized protein n=1 Tax=Natronolimnobius baerhuensis TaxID=253108 RepID=A0A202E7I2_9EURY|nr:hypothetical protein [Natronolimnobius baerhuensis]OVE83920.1 hypothetical protein B2G88_16040 [Natronolimnobius baerhuensis]
MHIVRGRAGGTELTGTLYERGEQAPSFSGAPNQDAAYVWICDEFYEVDSGGSVQQLEDREINLAFESPLPRGFDTREQALECANEHIRTQFARIGIDPGDVELEVETKTDTESTSDTDEQPVER